MRQRVAIDIGGTFIDPVALSPGKPFTLSKVLSTSEDLVSGLGDPPTGHPKQRSQPRASVRFVGTEERQTKSPTPGGENP